jgi:hypothetical protein
MSPQRGPTQKAKWTSTIAVRAATVSAICQASPAPRRAAQKAAASAPKTPIVISGSSTKRAQEACH